MPGDAFGSENAEGVPSGELKASVEGNEATIRRPGWPIALEALGVAAGCEFHIEGKLGVDGMNLSVIALDGEPFTGR